MRASAKSVLLFTSERVCGGVAIFSKSTHGLISQGIPQTVIFHVVEHADLAVLETFTRTGEEVRCLSHGLLATGNDDVVFASTNELISQCNGVDARKTDLVDRQRWNAHGDAALDRSLTSRNLASTGGEDLTHDHVIDLITGDTGLLECALNRDTTKIGTGKGLEATQEATDGGTRPRNDDGLCHVFLLEIQCGIGHCTAPSSNPDRGKDLTAFGGNCTTTGDLRLLVLHPMTSNPLVPGHLLVAIDHVGIAVPDLDDALEFYSRVFGLESIHEEVNEEQGVREAMLAVGDSGSCIQLLAPLTEDSTIAKFIDRNGQGIQQLAYRVTDIDAVSETLRDRGVRLLYETPKNGTSNSRVNFVHPKDAGGVLVELVEPAAH